MKNNKLIFALLSSLLLASCSTNSIPSTDSSGETPSTSDQTSETSINQGLEKDADKDTVTPKDINDLVNVFEKAIRTATYSYSTTLNLSGVYEEYTQYFTENAWYEENHTYPSTSFGYAHDTNKHVFKYYLDENGEGIPSLYLDASGESEEEGDGIYDIFMITSISLLDYYMTEDMATYYRPNSYILTDDNVQSIFQFMTTYGTSIAGYVQSYRIDIDNVETGEFTSVITLASNAGTITSKFTPLTSTPIDEISENAAKGQFFGINYYDDVKTLLDKTATNNYVLEGIKVRQNGVLLPDYSYKINCTENYFFLDYLDEDYEDYGYMYIPSGTEITYEDRAETTTTNVTVTNSYDTCFEYYKKSNGTYAFDKFVGPTPDGDYTFLAVNGYSNLPATGDSSVYYIVKDSTTGENSVYIWTVISTDSSGNETYGYQVFSSRWYNNVGEFYINDGYATFYLTSQGIVGAGQYYYEQDREDPNFYIATDSTITSALSNGLFGWGFQATDTWKDYINNAFIKINKDEAGNIASAEIGLNVSAVSSGTSVTLEIYYEISDFDNANLADIDTFYNETIGGTTL